MRLVEMVRADEDGTRSSCRSSFDVVEMFGMP
jgi:hypothetical protein